MELEFWSKIIKSDVVRAVSSSSTDSLDIQSNIFVIHQQLSFIEG